MVKKFKYKLIDKQNKKMKNVANISNGLFNPHKNVMGSFYQSLPVLSLDLNYVENLINKSD
jgi:hypothetical protein